MIDKNKKEYATYYGRNGEQRCEIITIIDILEIVIKIEEESKRLDCEFVIKNKLLILDNKELQKELETKIEEKNKENIPEPKGKRLYFPHCYGTAAYGIYLQLCEDFGFKRVLANNFEKNEDLFALNATVENYDVWFLAHSNCNGSQTTRWKNDVLNIDCDIIEEYFLGTDYEFQSFLPSKNDRLVFVKMYDNQYAFMGIYRQVDIDYMTKCRTYKRIKKEYIR